MLLLWGRGRRPSSLRAGNDGSRIESPRVTGVLYQEVFLDSSELFLSFIYKN